MEKLLYSLYSTLHIQGLHLANVLNLQHHRMTNLGVIIKQVSASLRCPQSGRWKGNSAEPGPPCGDPLVCCSSRSTQQPLVKNAGAITPAESESVNATKPSCRLLLPFHCCHSSNLSVLRVNRHAKGRAADTSGTESFSYTRTTKALLYLTVCLSVSHEVQLLARPSPFSSTWLTAWHPSPPAQCPVLTQVLLCPSCSPLSLLKWGQIGYYRPPLFFSWVVHINKGSWVYPSLSWVEFEDILLPSRFRYRQRLKVKSNMQWNIETKQQTTLKWKQTELTCRNIFSCSHNTGLSCVELFSGQKKERRSRQKYWTTQWKDSFLVRHIIRYLLSSNKSRQKFQQSL